MADSPRVLLTRPHVGLRIRYAPGTTNELFQVAHDSDGATDSASTNLLGAETPFLFGVEPIPDGIPLPARLQVAGVRGNVMRVVLTGPPRFPYVISTSPDLVRWSPAGVVTAGRSPFEFPVELPPDGGGWFFQIAAPSP